MPGCLGLQIERNTLFNECNPDFTSIGGGTGGDDGI